MKKLLKRLSAFCLASTLLLGLTIPAHAETMPPELGKVVDGSTLVKDDISEVTLYNRARGNILNRGIARVSDNGNGTVNAYGAVVGAVICDTMELTIQLQRYTGSYWTEVTTKSYSASNIGILSRSFNASVPGGYYYRVKAACVAKDGGAIESQMPVTNGIWVD